MIKDEPIDKPSNYVITPYLLFLIILPLLATKIALLLFNRKKLKLPPCPLKLPLIGNLHQLGSSPHSSLANLSLKYGPMMMLQLGQVPTLLISSPELAKEMLRTYDHIFASRPSLKAVDILGYGGKGLIFAPYGEYWRLMRKICTMHLFSSKEIKAFQHAREEEVAFMIGKVEAMGCGALVDMDKVLNAYANDVICRAVLGKSIREEGINDVFKEMIEMNVRLLSELFVGDYIPSLAWVDDLVGTTTRCKEQAKKWEVLLDKIIRDHVDRQMSANGNDDGDQERDFVDILLSVKDESCGDEKITVDHIKAMLLDIFGAGTDTTYITLAWAMAELSKNQHIMKKLQEEVRGVTKGKGPVKQEQLNQMVYLKAVIKETLRLHTAAPLLVIRESIEDCIVANYHIPKKTKVIINSWAISRDVKYWDSPEEFNPERFIINNELDYKGNHFQFIPFGAGRRICPGMHFSICSLELGLANLVHQFEWQLPHGLKSEDMDMTELPGLTTRRKQRLDLIVKPWPSCVA